MRRAFAHDGVIVLETGDVQALGAAVTVALCGAWDHDPPCPLAPHHTAAEGVNGDVRIRVLFACEPRAEPDVRERIEAALRRGELSGPEGPTTRWTFGSSATSPVREEEAAHARRLIES
jgi:hypothetical protein